MPIRCPEPWSASEPRLCDPCPDPRSCLCPFAVLSLGPPYPLLTASHCRCFCGLSCRQALVHRAHAQGSPLPPVATSPSPALPLPHDWTTAMVRTSGGHRYRPRVRFSTPERDDAGTSRAADAHSQEQATQTPTTLPPTATTEEVQALETPSRQYQTRVGPRAPSPEHQRPRRRAPPSKRARTFSFHSDHIPLEPPLP